MKQILSLLCIFISITGFSQETCSRIIDKATPVDTARYTVAYSLKYKFHPGIKDYYDDVRIVQIGKHRVKDYSDIINHFDSLATEQIRRGADSYSNVSGNPWPLEIVRPVRGANADSKYRLSTHTFLVYSDSVPTLEWNFSSNDTDTIMGYECRKATTEFAGRNYTAWYAPELPLPFGPYKFGGLPGLILKIEDGERQFVWEAIGFQQSNAPIMEYTYQDGNDKRCSVSDVEKTLVRYFKSPVAFLIAEMGGDSGRVHIVGKNGKEMDNSEASKMSIPYKPLEIR
ncbi:MAG: GLPGLI family protein [Muribaculaceae bacterium]|nr:GLPGLI family protein [Muribaculaceae bacterium]